MNLKVIRYLDLLWRILGCNILIILIAILKQDMAIDRFNYIIYDNILLMIFFTYHIFKKGFTMESNMSDILKLYIICRFALNIALIQTPMQSVLAVFLGVIEGLWITKFYMLVKGKN